MGEVWLGEHRATGVGVAVKVITVELARKNNYQMAFREEVRAVAGLEHPGIVTVYDYGILPLETEEMSDGQLIAGSPYYAMELASAGAVTELDGALSWLELKGLLVSILDALAYAHARGVIHLDLKPGNVLVCNAPSGDGQCFKLTDFGVAFAHDTDLRAAPELRVLGTPAYMAPEQFWIQWRDYGPWTDLYSLGCSAFHMASGELPFLGDSAARMARAHLHKSPGDFVPIIDVPAGFEGWLRRLMQRDPVHRFRRAADAAWALIALPDPPQESARPRVWKLSNAATLATTLAFSEMLPDESEEETVSEGRSDGALARRKVPAIPDRWEARRIETRRFEGAGLGLYGLRYLPLIGRKPERSLLWRRLQSVRKTSGVEVVVLGGKRGLGKSHLMKWLSVRAHEVGAAHVFRMEHDSKTGALGLATMIGTHLSCIGLRRWRVSERVEALLREYGRTDENEWIELSKLVIPASSEDVWNDEGAKDWFSTARERYAVVQRYLECLAQLQEGVRPVLLCLDRVHWGGDTLDFVLHLLRSRDQMKAAVLIVMTTTDDVLRSRPYEEGRLRELSAFKCVYQVQIEPLEPDEQRELVTEVLGLQGDLAERVSQWTKGDPHFAVQLVAHWVTEGVLRSAVGGLKLAAAEPDFPVDLAALLALRIDSFASSEGHDRVALEMGSALGIRVDAREWRLCCAAAEVIIPTDLVDRLVAGRLAVRSDTGWEFVNDDLRSAVIRRSKADGRWRALQGGIANVLHAVPGNKERVANHLLESGLMGEALEPILGGAKERQVKGDYRRAISLVEERERLMEEMGIPTSDSRFREGWEVQAACYRGQGEVGRANALIERGKEEDSDG